ncbi:MAG: hypothetical protein LBS64_00170 [Spirochaetaceae bacterium]|jgi:hypothetical protein|nr:hypothetical protein [Spirochaetaceae bacterium]
MGLIAYIQQYHLDRPDAPPFPQFNDQFFAAGNWINLFVIDFSAVILNDQAPGDIFSRCESLFSPPSRCVQEENGRMKILLAGKTKIDGDLFSFQIKKSLSPFMNSGNAEDIRVIPFGAVSSPDRIDSFLRSD